MQEVPSTDAQSEFGFVMEQVCSGLGPVLITGMRGNVVIVSEDEWRAVQSQLRRRSTTGVREPAVNHMAGSRGERGGENTV